MLLAIIQAIWTFKIFNIENFKVVVGGHEFKVGLMFMYSVPTSRTPICMSHNLLANLFLPFISPHRPLGYDFLHSSQSATSLLSAFFILRIAHLPLSLLLFLSLWINTSFYSFTIICSKSWQRRGEKLVASVTNFYPELLILFVFMFLPLNSFRADLSWLISVPATLHKTWYFQ